MQNCNFKNSFKKIFLFTIICITIIGNGIFVSPVNAEKISVRLGTGKEGSSGYSCAVGIAASIKKRLDNVDMVAIPTPGSSASVKIFSKGDTDFAYASTWTLRDAYNETGPFAKSPIENKPLQGWYYLTAEWVFVTKIENKDINSLKDLNGKKVYPHPAGTGIFDVYKTVLTELQIWNEIEVRQVDPSGVADALQMGSIDVVGAASVLNGRSAPPWVRDLDTRLEIKVIIPSPDEQILIQQINGLSTGIITKDWMRPKNKENNPEDLWTWSIHYGFHPGKNLPTEVMYKIYKTWIEYAKKDLAPVNTTLKYYSENPLEVQLRGIDEAKDIPVHPGVAKYLKEKGIWKDSWKIGELNPGVY